MDLHDLKLSDLYETCEKCGGTGHYEWRADPKQSRGFGMHQIGGSGPCDKCNGQGGRYTKLGEVLAQFMQSRAAPPALT